MSSNPEEGQRNPLHYYGRIRIANKVFGTEDWFEMASWVPGTASRHTRPCGGQDQHGQRQYVTTIWSRSRGSVGTSPKQVALGKRRRLHGLQSESF